MYSNSEFWKYEFWILNSDNPDSNSKFRILKNANSEICTFQFVLLSHGFWNQDSENSDPEFWILNSENLGSNSEIWTISIQNSQITMCIPYSQNKMFEFWILNIGIPNIDPENYAFEFRILRSVFL